MRARSQSSAYWRIGELPMKHRISISMPTFCEMSIDRLDVVLVGARRAARLDVEAVGA